MAEAVRADGGGRPVRWLLVAIAAVVTGVFLWLAVRTIDLGETWRALRTSEWEWILPSLALLALATWIRAVRWWALFAPGHRPPLRAATASLLVGLFFNNILPFRAGEAARLVDLSRRAVVSRTQVVATIAVERVFDLVCLLLLLFLTLPFLPDVSWVRSAAILAAALGAGLLVAILVLAVYGDRALRVAAWPLRWLPFVTIERWEHAPRNLGLGLAALRRPRIAAVGLSLTFVSWLVMAASFWALMPAFHLGLGYEAGALVLVAVGLGLVVPAPPAAFGVFEAAVVVALAAFDVAASLALSYALVLHAVNFVPFVAAGVPVTLRRPG